MADPDHPQSQDPGLAVSVVVCTHDRERFLPGVLESLARQTAPPASYEVVVVDSASTDGTALKCRTFGAAHPELALRYVHEARGGLSRARNRGCVEARGRVITFIDDDAIAMPDLVEAVTAFFAAHPDAAAVGGRVLAVFDDAPPDWWNRFSAPLFFSHHDRGERAFRFTRRNGYPFGCNMSFRADVLRTGEAFDTSLGRHGGDGIGGEEKALFARLIAQGAPCWYDPRQVVQHRIEGQRTTQSQVQHAALGLGQTHRLLYCRHGRSMRCAWQFAVVVAKVVAAIGLAAAYFLRGRPEVSRHLVWYRWLVLVGYVRGARTAP